MKEFSTLLLEEIADLEQEQRKSRSKRRDDCKFVVTISSMGSEYLLDIDWDGNGTVVDVSSKSLGLVFRDAYHTFRAWREAQEQATLETQLAESVTPGVPS